MALRVVRSPGCREILRPSELALGENELVIDTGQLARAMGYDPTAARPNRAILPIASAARTTAIKAAIGDGVDAVVRTGDRSARALDRLRALAPNATVTDIPITRSEACRRIRALYPNDRDRQLLCERGLDRYFNGE